jgi:hypothetical protein
VIYTHAAAALVAAVLAFSGAWKIQDWRHGAQEAARLEQEREAQVLRARSVDAAAASHEGEREQLSTAFKVITKEVDRIVEKPIYRNVCIEDDGLMQLRRAIHPGEVGNAE